MAAGSVALHAPGAMYDGVKRGWNNGMENPADPFGPFTGAAKGAAVGGLASVLGSQGGVFALRQLSEYLDESTQAKQERELDPQAHGLLAKDQPGHENDAFGNLKTVKFEFAHALSVAADKLVTAKMKAVINAPDTSTADGLLKDIYTELDNLVALPSLEHPLAAVIKEYREKGMAALKASHNPAG